MAVAKPAAPAAEQTEREFQAEINHAVAETESEIFGDATGDAPLDNDGDTSLEAVGDAMGVVAEEEEGGATIADGAEPFADATDADGSDPPRDEGETPPAVEAQNATLRTQLSTLEARFNDLQARLSGQGQQQPRPAEGEASEPGKPDMFANPDAYEKWLVDRATRDTFALLRQQQQSDDASRVGRSLANAARSERGFEFSAAYNALTALDPRNPDHQALVHGIYNAPDPGGALFDWWDENGGPQFRQQILAQLVPRDQREQQGHRQQRGGAARTVQPRYEYRTGQSLPSLNSAAGSNSQRISQPEFLDNTDASVFDFATRR